MNTRTLTNPPGGPLMWIIVAAELLTFVMVFAAIAWMRRTEPGLFAGGQARLDPRLGLGLTLCLLTSGAAAAHGVQRWRAGAWPAARRSLGLAAALGVGFLAAKVWDYAHHAGLGHTLGASSFWDLYLLSTGFHFIHVLVGVGLLASAASSSQPPPEAESEASVAGPALFWHLCDVIWIFLFALFFARSP